MFGCLINVVVTYFLEKSSFFAGKSVMCYAKTTEFFKK